MSSSIEFRLGVEHSDLLYRWHEVGPRTNELVLFAPEQYDPDKHFAGPHKIKHNGVTYIHYLVL